jgi:hypothetical protein
VDEQASEGVSKAILKHMYCTLYNGVGKSKVKGDYASEGLNMPVRG